MVRYAAKQLSEEALPVSRHHDCLCVVDVGCVRDRPRNLLHARRFGTGLDVRVFVSDREFLGQRTDLPFQLFGVGMLLLLSLEDVGYDYLRAGVFGEIEGDVDRVPFTRVKSDREDYGGVAPGPFYALPLLNHPWILHGISDR